MLNSTGRIALITITSAALVLSGCSKETSSESSSAPATSSAAASATSSAAATSDVAKADAPAGQYPVSVDNCGFTVNMTKAPTRIVTMNQGATELALALGAADQMVGTAYLDGEIDPSVKAEYDKIPVLAKEYPSQEQLLNAKPDFVIASYSSAFKPEAAGPRNELAELKIQSYLDPFGCKDKAQRAAAKWDSVYSEVTDLGQLLGRSSNAKKLVTDMKGKVADLEKNKAGAGKTVLWYDSGTDTPFVGAGQGGPQLILDTVGAKNIFADLDGNWKKSTWEAVLTANPDYIVLADASWDTAADKEKYLKENPATKDLKAVKDNHFIVVPFAETTPGVHLINGAAKVAAGLSK